MIPSTPSCRTALPILVAAWLLAAPLPASADAPIAPSHPKGAEKAALEKGWDAYRAIREDLAYYRLSPEEGIAKLTRLADESKGTDVEPFLKFHVAVIHFQRDRFDEARRAALDVKERWPKHYLCTHRWGALRDLPQVDAFIADIDDQLETRKEVTVDLPNPGPDPSPRVVLETTNGRIVIGFYPKYAPSHVASFLKNVESALYDGTEVIVVHPGLRIFLGDKAGSYPKPADPRLPSEINVLPHTRGAVAMFYIDSLRGDDARQFCICFGHPTFLDLESTVFGRVVEGMEVVDTIGHAQLDPQGFFPVKPIRIEKAWIDR